LSGRHCERSEAIQSAVQLDCFAPLAMTKQLSPTAPQLPPFEK
jgi:hypothetical protein